MKIDTNINKIYYKFFWKGCDTDLYSDSPSILKQPVEYATLIRVLFYLKKAKKLIPEVRDYYPSPEIK